MADGFDALLQSLDADRDLAGLRYEELRRKLIRFFEWRGVRYPEECADDTLDRVSKRLGAGLAVEHLAAYCYEVARLVSLEALKEPQQRVGALNEDAAHVPAAGADADVEQRMACLERCLESLPADSRQLILEYYRQPAGRSIDARRALAERLGLHRDALANRAQRVRNKLEDCVTRCLEERDDRRRTIEKRPPRHTWKAPDERA